MIAHLRLHSMQCAALLFATLLIPPVKHALEASMITQMLLQIPLLIAVGWLLRDAIPRRISAAADAWNRHGIAGLLLATFAAAYWMLPRVLDAAVTDPLVAVAKYLSVPLLIGLPFAASWPRMTFIVRGVFLVECIATFFRLGWLYMVSPIRLCSNYLLDDQQRTGTCMLAIGSALFLWMAWKLLWGRFDSVAAPRQPSRMLPGSAHHRSRG